MRHDLEWSGRRGSNPRHPAWEADALPAELRPHSQTNIANAAAGVHGRPKSVQFAPPELRFDTWRIKMSLGRRLLIFAALAFATATARAATYLPVSDAELVRRSPLVVRGRVLDQTVRLEKIDGRDLPFTITTVQVVETLKGSVAGLTVKLRLPGGKLGELASWFPGTPTFRVNQDVLLMMRPAEGRPGEYHLSEFGLSRFDLVQDESGRGFAVRPAFGPDEDLSLSQHAVAASERSPGSRRAPLRDAESFLSALRASGQGGGMPDVRYGEPSGALSNPAVVALKPEWVNLGGPEPGSCGTSPCLFRWFWDTGQSQNAVVSVSGAQMNLSDGTNGMTHTQHGIDQWHTGVPSTDIRISGITGGGNITVNLEAPMSHDGGATWNASLPCGTGGVIGLGSTSGFAGKTFKGEANYVSSTSGTVSMRQRTGSMGCYSAATFRTGVMHELGHSLGLGHPDQAQSTHSSTTSTDWNTAVMHSTVPPSAPSTPQADDIQAMQYYYGTGNLCTPNATTMCLSNARFKLTTAWVSSTQSGQGNAFPLTSDTGYFWFFSSSNVEMVVKVLNACTLNSNYWIFAGGLTNVQVTLTVTDMQSGNTKTYVNPQGTPYAPLQKTTDFPNCP